MVRGISGASSAPEWRTARTRCASSSPALPATLKNVASSTPPKKTTSKTLPGPSEDKAPPQAQDRQNLTHRNTIATSVQSTQVALPKRAVCPKGQGSAPKVLAGRQEDHAIRSRLAPYR